MIRLKENAVVLGKDGEELVWLNVRMPRELKKQVRLHAAKKECTVSEWVRRALDKVIQEGGT